MKRRVQSRARALLAVCVLSFSIPSGAAFGHVPQEDVEISVGDTPAPVQAAPAPASATAEEVAQLRAQLAAVEQRLAEAQAQSAVQAKELTDVVAEARAEREAQQRAAAERERSNVLARLARLGVSISGYIQVQYGQNQLSEDQLLQGGTPLNQNRFAVRRGRVRVNGRWKYVRSDFELDGSNTRGPTFSVRRASISGVLPSSDENALPLLLLTAGISEIPLGLELQQGQDEILFLERTTGSLALFHGPIDTGVKLEGAYGPLRLQLAVMNGTPIDDRAGGPSGLDPNAAPDYLGRVGLDAKPHAKFRIVGGASFLSGTGFHAGSEATKSVLQWDDRDADGQFSLTEVVQVSGEAPTPSRNFDRWAVGADLAFELETGLGLTRLYGEITLASNLDRGLYVADPTLTSRNIRELGWYVALVQDVTQWGFVGARYDVYDPDSDLTDTRRGRSLLRDAAIETISPVAGLHWPGLGRLTFQYDVVRDSLARNRRGEPTDVENNQWTVRAQGEF